MRTNATGNVGPVTPSRYVEIADQLAGELVGVAPGSRIDSEHRIGQRFGVGRAAARAALQELERRLLVRRTQGAGTFVNQRIDYTISHDRRPSWHDTVTAAGAHPRTVVRALDTVPLPPEQAAALELPVGTPGYRLVRESYIGELLAANVQEWVPVARADHLSLALRVVESLDLVLRAIPRVEPVRAWCRVSLDVPPPEVCAGLQVERSKPVWLVESLSRDGADGQPLMCSRSWMRSDAVRVVVELGSMSGPDQPGSRKKEE